MAEVKFENVTKKFEDFTAVENLNLEIKDGEFFVILGPSGSGKTTTLRMIAGLEKPTEGKIFIGEDDVTELPPKERNVAMVFQNYALYPHLTVYDNMAFALKLRRKGFRRVYSREEIDERVRNAAKMLHIEDQLEKKPGQLSGGQRQRVALGRAIVRNPRVFLFDEPLSNLDAKLRMEMRVELKKLHQALGVTMVYVTHDQLEAMTLGNRIAVLNKGEVMQVDDPITLYNNPRNLFVAKFIGSPEMNMFDCTLNAGYLEFDGFKLKVPEDIYERIKEYEGKTLTFGIRPEDVLDSLFAKELDGERIEAKIEVIEPVGSETFAHLKVGEMEILARFPPMVRVSAGESMKIVFNMRKMHLFIDGEAIV
ncbi:MAG: ABC transporter ATP-binding protein [Euryarchaeota archaeon]|nr:ABC transporter ATP-binding protein [Euryarchaeota archaeon]